MRTRDPGAADFLNMIYENFRIDLETIVGDLRGLPNRDVPVPNGTFQRQNGPLHSMIEQNFPAYYPRLFH